MKYEERIKLAIENLQFAVKRLQGELTAEDAIEIESDITEVVESQLGKAFDERFPDRGEI